MDCQHWSSPGKVLEELHVTYAWSYLPLPRVPPPFTLYISTRSKYPPSSLCPNPFSVFFVSPLTLSLPVVSLVFPLVFQVLSLVVFLLPSSSSPSPGPFFVHPSASFALKVTLSEIASVRGKEKRKKNEIENGNSSDGASSLSA